jgi:cytochrome c biogenesis factor
MKLFAPFHLAYLVLIPLLLFLKDYGVTLLIDVPSRVNLNLAYIDSIYLLWTNLIYIYKYFIPIIIIVYISIYMPTVIYFIPAVLSCALLFIFMSIPLYVSPNVFLGPPHLSSEPNTLLLNSVNKYHPVLLYLSFFAILAIYHLNNNYSLYYKSAAIIHKKSFIPAIFFLIAFTMFLGSWWAYQEGSWGGWWAWDPSETFGLCIFLAIAYLKHCDYTGLTLNKINFRSKFSTYTLVLVYIFLQTNFGLTSHNFGMRDAIDVGGRQIYITLILLLFLLPVYVVVARKYVHALTACFRRTERLKAVKYYVYQVLILLFLSVVPLVTDLAWKVITVQFYNLQVSYWLIILLVLVLILLFLATPALDLYLILFLSFSILLFPPYIAILYTILALRPQESNYFYNIHFCIFTFLLASIFSNMTAVSMFMTSSFYLNYNSACFFFTAPFYGMDNLYLNYKNSGAIILSESTFNISNFIMLFSLVDLEQNFVFYLLKLSGVSTILDTLSTWLLSIFYVLNILLVIPMTGKRLILC